MTAIWPTPRLSHEYAVSFAIAVAVHVGVVMIGGTSWLWQPARYAVHAGAGGMEVQLVAAPAAPRGRPVPAKTAPATDTREPKTREPDVMTVPAAHAPATTSWPMTGDGSSPIPGFHDTTWYSPGGARGASGPMYLRNPAPPYPAASREQGEQGRVVLLIHVDTAGRPAGVQIIESSGYPRLDEAALTTVRRWTFAPARVAAVPVASSVKVPIRFVLDE